MKKVIYTTIITGLFLALTSSALAQGRGNGRGIGGQVSQAARSGLHGQNLAQYIHNLNAARGIGNPASGAYGGNARGGYNAGGPPGLTRGKSGAKDQDYGNGKNYGKGSKKTHGNNGLGNGVDPSPPGNPPVNDGPGHGPGNPGNRGRGIR